MAQVSQTSGVGSMAVSQPLPASLSMDNSELGDKLWSESEPCATVAHAHTYTYTYTYTRRYTFTFTYTLCETFVARSMLEP